MSKERKPSDQPLAASQWGWRYHHLGIPTTRPHPGEVYLPELKLHVAGYETSPFGVEWMRFDPDCEIHELIRTVPHLAFEVDDLKAALAGRRVISPTSSPCAGVRVAMIEDDGAPIELMEFSRPRTRRRRAGQA